MSLFWNGFLQRFVGIAVDFVERQRLKPFLTFPVVTISRTRFTLQLISIKIKLIERVSPPLPLVYCKKTTIAATKSKLTDETSGTEELSFEIAN